MLKQVFLCAQPQTSCHFSWKNWTCANNGHERLKITRMLIFDKLMIINVHIFFGVLVLKKQTKLYKDTYLNIIKFGYITVVNDGLRNITEYLRWTHIVVHIIYLVVDIISTFIIVAKFKFSYEKVE